MMRKFLTAALPLAVMLASTAQAEPAAPTPAAQATAPAPAVAAPRAALIGAAINVSDLQKSLKFYRDAFGMRVMMQFTPPGAPARAGQKPSPDTVLSAGNGPADAMLMLLSDRDPAGPRAIGHVFGFARVVLRFSNLDSLAARLRENGFTPGEIHTAHGAFRVMMVTDPDGYTVEVIEQRS